MRGHGNTPALTLFADPTPPPLPARIDLRCADCTDVELVGDLAVADPPWAYREAHGESSADDHYAGLPVEAIVEHLRAIDAPRLALWITWPILAADWPAELPKWGRPVTGGVWVKSAKDDAGHYGQGYHWAGCSEAVLVYTRGGAFTDRAMPLRNAWIEAPGLHSRKPVGWQRQWVRRWCPPGGRVVEAYAGLGSTAEAVLTAGDAYAYRGAEVDVERHRQALGLLAQVRE